MPTYNNASNYSLSGTSWPNDVDTLILCRLTLHQNIDIFSLSETHAADEPGDLYNIDGYIYVNKPRRSGRGGGVGIYISDKINWIRRHDLEKPEIECIWIEIIQKKSKNLLLCAIYRPPDTSKYHHKNFDKTFNDMLLLTNELEAIIMGDINVNFLKTNDHPAIKSVLSLNGFKQLLKAPTRTQDNSPTLIDIVATNNPFTISVTGIIPFSCSDHDVIVCVRKMNHRKYQHKEIKSVEIIRNMIQIHYAAN